MFFRCGDIFCSDCTGYRRKLNKFAQPDPLNGEMQPVSKLDQPQHRLHK